MPRNETAYLMERKAEIQNNVNNKACVHRRTFVA